jgi:hypothetical protein
MGWPIYPPRIRCGGSFGSPPRLADLVTWVERQWFGHLAKEVVKTFFVVVKISLRWLTEKIGTFRWHWKWKTRWGTCMGWRMRFHRTPPTICSTQLRDVCTGSYDGAVLGWLLYFRHVSCEMRGNFAAHHFTVSIAKHENMEGGEIITLFFFFW